MQAQSQLRVLARQADGIFRSFLIDHQAGRGENTFAMGASHRLVDAAGAAEIIGIDDETPALISVLHSLAPSFQRAAGTKCGRSGGLFGFG